jgi:Zn-finger nucleic acid-binding protein
MASIKTNTEVLVDIDINVECMQCGKELDVYIRDTKIQVDICPRCYGKLESEIDELKDQIEKLG